MLVCQFVTTSLLTSAASPQMLRSWMPCLPFQRSIHPPLPVKSSKPNSEASAFAFSESKGPLTGSAALLACLNHCSRASSTLACVDARARFLLLSPACRACWWIFSEFFNMVLSEDGGMLCFWATSVFFFFFSTSISLRICSLSDRE